MEIINNLFTEINIKEKESDIRSQLLKAIFNKRILWIGSPFLMIVIWEIIAQPDIVAPYILPAPTAIAREGFNSLVSGELLIHVLASLKRALPAFIIGSAAGIFFGIMMAWSRIFNTIVDIPFNLFRAIPKVALIPLFMVWFGLGEGSKILVIMLSPFAKLAINTEAGVKNVDSSYIKAARALGAKDRSILKEVMIPASLPMIFAGLRLSVVISMILLVVVEMQGASSGLGYMIRNSSDFLQTDKMFVGVFVLSLLALAMDGIVRFAESKILVWQR